MKGLNSFIATMIFYIVLSYVLMPLVFFYFVEKSRREKTMGGRRKGNDMDALVELFL